MKIYLFTDCLGPGGAQRQLVGLAVMLKEYGYDIRVCTYYCDNFYKNYLDENGVQNDIIPNAAHTKKRIFAVWNYFRREQPDWVVAYQETPSLVSCIVRVLGCNFKLLVSERNTTQNYTFSTKLRFFLYRVADAIVPNSYTQESFMLSCHSWMKYKLKTITNYVDLDKFRFVRHIRHDVPEILVVASLKHSKNPTGFIEACSILKTKGLKFHVSWYGIVAELPEYVDLCNNLIEKKNLQSFFSIHNKTTEIEKKYQEADYFCLPSFFEGTPNVICEAMSVGLPIICSNVCDNPFYVTKGVNGFLFDPESPQDIAEKLEESLCLSFDNYNKFCEASRQIAEDKLNKELFIKKYLRIINASKTN